MSKAKSYQEKIKNNSFTESEGDKKAKNIKKRIFKESNEDYNNKKYIIKYNKYNKYRSKKRKLNTRFCKFIFIIFLSFLYRYFIISKSYKSYNKSYNSYNSYINVAYAFDNIYYYITHVSMKSLMMNQNNDTFIKFFILVSKDIYEEQKEVIDKICQEHINCNITYFQLTNEFKEISPKGGIVRTTAIFYRTMLQNLLVNETKALYLDCDTIIYRDLTELYNYNIEDKYYTGAYESGPMRKYGSNLKDFINSGVILINLENLRKDNIFPKMMQFLRDHNGHLNLLDQDAINVVCNAKNGFFPKEYVSTGVCDPNTLNYLKGINRSNKNEDKKQINYKNNPYVFHFISYDKPWYGIAKGKLLCYDFFPRFYEYARKSSYYFEILAIFKVNKRL